VLAARNALSPEIRQSLDARITEQLCTLAAWRNAECVLAYASFGSEFDTTTFIAQTLAAGKRLCLPRVVRNPSRLAIHQVQDWENDLAPGAYGIREPRSEICPPVALDEIDFVLVPGVAFNPQGARLGYGEGFYDGLIETLPERPRRPHLVAAAYALQIQNTLPLEAHDQRLDRIITESASYSAP
jgi:5-formyltetrahydrofolate cyclo-ligase